MQTNIIDFRKMAEKVLADRAKGSTAKLTTANGWNIYANKTPKAAEMQVEVISWDELMKQDDIDTDFTRY